MEDCLFCQIVAGQIPSTIIYQDQDVLAFRDINPQARQHILFVSKRHIASVDALTPEDSELLGKIFAAASHVAHDLGLERGYRLITNVGPEGGQTVAHLHFHLLGGQQLGWTPA